MKKYSDLIFKILEIKPFEEFKLASPFISNKKCIYRLLPNMVVQYKESSRWLNDWTILPKILNGEADIQKLSITISSKPNIFKKINADDCIDYVKNKLNIQLFGYQEEMLRAFCEGKKVATGRGIGRTYIARAFSKYIEHLYLEDNYDAKPDITI